MKKFRTWYDTSIEEIEIASETEKFVTLACPYGMRMSKSSINPYEYHYFDSRVEAHNFLIARERIEIFDLERKIKQHQETLRKLQEMSQP